MLQQYTYLLIGSGATLFKTALGLDQPLYAGVKTETYWNNRTTPLPPGVHLLLSEEEGKPPQLKVRQWRCPELCLGESSTAADEIGEIFMRYGALEAQALAPGSVLAGANACGSVLQPANTTGLFPDTKIQAYEERYCQDDLELIFRQGITYFALNHAQQWVFIGAEPQAIYVTMSSLQPKLRGKVLRALEAANALPTIPPANHAQQLTRMQAWWWGGERPVNRPLKEQLPPMAHLEIESKLAVQQDFSSSCWQLVERLQKEALPGFTTYQSELLVRHSHDIVRYLKGKNKLILQGAAYRFGQKGLASPEVYAHYQDASKVMIRVEEKPDYRPITTFATAQAIHAEVCELKPVGDVYCHKRKFTVQSLATGGGYHVLIDTCTALAAPDCSLVQIEVECQWKKIPPHQTFADPIATAIAEIEQLTQAIHDAVAGTQPTQLTKRSWLKQMLGQKVMARPTPTLPLGGDCQRVDFLGWTEAATSSAPSLSPSSFPEFIEGGGLGSLRLS